MATQTIRLGFTLGDPSGIGPELIAKTLNSKELPSDVQFVVIGDRRNFAEGVRVAGVKLDLPEIASLEALKPDVPAALMHFSTAGPGDFPVGKVSKEAGKAAFDTLVHALDLARANKIDGFVFGPLNKEAMHLGGNPYNSELEYFQAAFQQEKIENELNFLDELWTTRVTSHIGLRQVCELITKERVHATIRFMDQVLRDYGHANPKIAVAALNPHAGEHGLFGREELDEIEPAIAQARAEGLAVDGPFPADTVFARVRREKYHGLVSMYHDQGQIAMKLVGFERGVTVAGGLPVPISTPAHGTAHDIAGRGVADIGATLAAIRVISNMIRSRR